MSVALLLVSHVGAIADGVRALAAQMAADVPIYSAGGTDDEDIGTSFAKIEAALGEAIQHDGVVVLYDLGSALLTAEMATEMLSPEYAGRTQIVDAPLVEGAVAAAAAAQQGSDLAAVAEAARTVLAPSAGEGRASPPPAGAAERTVVLKNELGLHARPAADLARAVGGLDAQVWVGRGGEEPLDAVGVVGVIALSLRGGEAVSIWADGPDADAALDEVVGLIDAGFGELDDDGPWQGTGVAPGTASGPTTTVTLAAPTAQAGARGADDEAQALRTAMDAVESELRATTGAFASIASAHAVLLRDPMLVDAAMRSVARGTGAAEAWWSAVQGAADMLAGLPDTDMADRAADVWDLGHRVLTELEANSGDAEENVRGRIVICEFPLPSRIDRWAGGGVAGVATTHGGSTSHGAQLATALNVPMVSGLPASVLVIGEDTVCRLDGGSGSLAVDQSPDR